MIDRKMNKIDLFSYIFWYTNKGDGMKWIHMVIKNQYKYESIELYEKFR